MTGQLFSARPGTAGGPKPVMGVLTVVEQVDTSWLVALDIDGTTLHE
ncbi:MAG: hypothetical protein QOE32_6607, partial [Pseudonocardiales bacterium]|nr:hypothetical protein [Pseudonocardiales bacterium]